MARSRRPIPRFGFFGFVVRRHRRLLTTAMVTVGLIGVWLYVRYHHAVVDAQFTSVDCGTWGDRTYAATACFDAFGGFHDLVYLVSSVGPPSVALFFIVVLLQTLARPRAFARGRKVVLRSIGPRDAKALAATVDAAVIVENRLPFNVVHTLRRVARWYAVPDHLAICETDTGRLVGCISLTGDLEEMHANLGFWIGPRDRGKGYATDALATCAPMLHDRGFSKVIAETSVDNRAMRAALEHAGFESAGNFTFTFPSGETILAARYVSLAGPDQLGATSHPADPLDA